MAEAMTKEQAMTVAVSGERAALGDLLPALKTLFATVRDLEIEATKKAGEMELIKACIDKRERMTVAMPSAKMALAVHLIVEEALGAHAAHGPLLNAHHFEGVFREECDKLWDEVKKKEPMRDPAKMRREAKQAAAVLLRFMLDCCLEKGGIVRESVPHTIGEGCVLPGQAA